MKRMLFNATHAEELRVAIVDGQKLIDLDIETQGHEQRKSNIYKGKVTRVEPSLEACFVDYGEERHGFLPFKEISRQYFKQGVDVGRARINEAISEGQELIVQVEKEERGNKGAALTTFISLAGRYLVLMPNNPRGGGVSRRVEGEDRQELRDHIDQLDLPAGTSVIARTAGIGRSFEELQWDLKYLQQLWKAITDAVAQVKAPELIYLESSLVIRAIRDYFHPEIGEILIDTDDVFEQANTFVELVMPDIAPRVKRYRDDVPLFSRFQIEHQIETAYSRMVPLPSGGAIVLDHTEALVAVDVNSARSTKGSDIEETALKTNVEAADEVARQLRLRDLGGLIVIDFIDMEETKNQRVVEQRLKDALHYDRARVQMGKISRFGLMELSRQRLRPALVEGSHTACPRCNGVGVIRDTESSALHILRILQEEAMKENTAAIHAQVPVDVATYLLNEKRPDIAKMEARLRVTIVLIPNKFLETPHYNIERLKHDDERLDVARASFDRVLAPATEAAYAGTKADDPRNRQQDAVVKGIVPDTPAPLVVAAPTARTPAPAQPVMRAQAPGAPSLWERIKSWFNGDAAPTPLAVGPAAAAPVAGAERSGERSRGGGRGDRRQERGRDERRRDGRAGGRGGERGGQNEGRAERTDKQGERQEQRGAARVDGGDAQRRESKPRGRGERDEKGRDDRGRDDRVRDEKSREDKGRDDKGRDGKVREQKSVEEIAARDGRQGELGQVKEQREGRGQGRRDNRDDQGVADTSQQIGAAAAAIAAPTQRGARNGAAGPHESATPAPSQAIDSLAAASSADPQSPAATADSEERRGRRRRRRRGRGGDRDQAPGSEAIAADNDAKTYDDDDDDAASDASAAMTTPTTAPMAGVETSDGGKILLDSPSPIIVSAQPAVRAAAPHAAEPASAATGVVAAPTVPFESAPISPIAPIPVPVDATTSLASTPTMVTPAPTATAGAAVASAAPIALPASAIAMAAPVSARVQPAPLPLDELKPLLESAGMTLTQTDPERLAKAAARMATETPPPRAQRERPVLPPVEEAPLVQIETRQ